jgi:hypothetical protein
MCACVAHTLVPIIGTILEGPVHIQLTPSGVDSHADFASAAGHELKHAENFTTNTAKALREEGIPCTCRGGNELENAAYKVQDQIDKKISNSH